MWLLRANERRPRRAVHTEGLRRRGGGRWVPHRAEGSPEAWQGQGEWKGRAWQPGLVPAPQAGGRAWREQRGQPLAAPGTDIGHLPGDGDGPRPGGTSGCGCLGLGGACGQGREGGEELETGTAMAWLGQGLTLVSSPQEYFPGKVFPLWGTTASQWCCALAELWERSLVKRDNPMLSLHPPCLLAGLERASRRLVVLQKGQHSPGPGICHFLVRGQEISMALKGLGLGIGLG